MHVDMDAFYASVEEADHPDYKGKPLIIGADPKQGTGRGVVATCSYAARAFGVRSALPISLAYKKCPQGVYIRPRMFRYSEVSSHVMEILESFADAFQQVSIDEAYLDVSSCGDYSEAERIGAEIKEKIRDALRITASIGIGPNKLVAKIASDQQNHSHLFQASRPAPLQ